MEQMLEIGPGTYPRLTGKNVVYLDRRDLPLPNLVVWDLQNLPLPFPDDTFDECQAYQVFEHIPCLAPVFDDLHRILKPDGILKLTVPHYSREYREGPWLDHVHLFTERSFRNLEQDMCMKQWKIICLKALKFKDFPPQITGAGRIIKNIPLRKFAWHILNFWRLNKLIDIYVELMPKK